MSILLLGCTSVTSGLGWYANARVELLNAPSNVTEMRPVVSAVDFPVRHGIAVLVILHSSKKVILYLNNNIILYQTDLIVQLPFILWSLQITDLPSMY